MITIFIDDLFIICNSIAKIKAAKIIFHTYFSMSDLRFYKYYLGMIITKDCKNQILLLRQCAYLEKILIDY